MPEAGTLDGFSIPEELFERIAQTQDLSELKAVLFVLRLSGSGGIRAVLAAELSSPGVIRAIAGPHHPEGGERRAQRAVERAVTNGTVLRLSVGTTNARRQYLLPATRQARSLIERLRAEDPEIAGEM